MKEKLIFQKVHYAANLAGISTGKGLCLLFSEKMLPGVKLKHCRG
jgi:hypothetical protein